MMDVIQTKICILFALLTSCLTAALIPFCCFKKHLKKQTKREIWQHRRSLKSKPSALESILKPFKHNSRLMLSSLNCFAGGIFLCTSFVELLPEVRHNFEEYSIAWSSSSSITVINASESEDGVVENEVEKMPLAELVTCAGLFMILFIEQIAHTCHDCREKSKERQSQDKVALQKTDPKESLDLVDQGSVEGYGGFEVVVEHSSDDFSVHELGSQKGHDHSGIRSLLLVTSLSIHSLLEGLAIGLQESTGNVIAIFTAVLVHKSLIAFSMGTNLVHSQQSKSKIISAACIFAFMSPVGILAGILLQYSGTGNSNITLVNAILQGLACGAFVYIAFFEVLVTEFNNHRHRIAKLISLIVGFMVIFAIFYFQHQQ